MLDLAPVGSDQLIFRIRLGCIRKLLFRDCPELPDQLLQQVQIVFITLAENPIALQSALRRL